MTFQFKQQARDFYVTELLPFTPSGEGDALYVLIEKRNLTTHDVITHLRETFGISRKTIGIAGLKDKRAVAKQRITIYDSALSKIGGERKFVDALSKIVRIVDVTRHEFPIGLSTPIANEFHIRLRSPRKLGQSLREKSIQIVQDILDDGYPNLFGDQRFGIHGCNRKQWLDIMRGSSHKNSKLTKSEQLFKLQAFSSKMFNDYVKQRVKKWLNPLDGDIVTRYDGIESRYGILDLGQQTITPCDVQEGQGSFFFVPRSTAASIDADQVEWMLTGPVPWYNQPLADRQAGEVEKWFLQRHHLDATSMKVYQQFRLYGLRRALWVFPTDTSVRYQRDDLLIDFTLPAGSYASILVDKLDEVLGGESTKKEGREKLEKREKKKERRSNKS